MTYATTTNEPNRTLYSNFTLFNFVTLMYLWVCLCIRERKERKDIGIDLSRLYQVCGQKVKMRPQLIHSLKLPYTFHIYEKKKPEVKAINPIIFRKN